MYTCFPSHTYCSGWRLLHTVHSPLCDQKCIPNVLEWWVGNLLPQMLQLWSFPLKISCACVSHCCNPCLKPINSTGGTRSPNKTSPQSKESWRYSKSKTQVDDSGALVGFNPTLLQIAAKRPHFKTWCTSIPCMHCWSWDVCVHVHAITCHLTP